MKNTFRQTSPLKAFISSADSVIQIFSIGSIAIIIGLFVNFIFDITTLFTNNNDPCWTNEKIYLLLNAANILIFYFIIKKYLSFTSDWLRMQKRFNNQNSSEKDLLFLLNEAEQLITNHYHDFSRYMLLFVFIFIVINRKVPIIMGSLNNISPEPHLYFFGLLLYVFIICIIEWPTINLYCLYKKSIRSNIAPQENMAGSL